MEQGHQGVVPCQGGAAPSLQPPLCRLILDIPLALFATQVSEKAVFITDISFLSWGGILGRQKKGGEYTDIVDIRGS